ncbi:MAG: cytochrome c biogenesis protein CcsA [Candidatus Krumholzibacteriota bacterium]|nr:cytochrome c biogenesis protein CcsA [Candidatus Krumholzibacteriota bacterium]
MSGTPDVQLFWISFWLFLGSTAVFSLFLGFGRRALGRLGAALFIGGFLFLTAGYATRWVLAGHPPFSNMYEYALTMSWTVAFAFIVIIRRFGNLEAGVIVAPVIVMVMVVASMLPKEISRQLMPALQSYWFYIHVSLAAVAEGAFLTAAGGGIFWLVRRGRTRDLVEEIISRSIRIGYPLFTVGALFAGMIWAKNAWGRFWSWDPKETGALVIWLFYTMLLHQNMRGRWFGRTLAVLAIVGFVIILLSFLGNLFLGGLHAYI